MSSEAVNLGREALAKLEVLAREMGVKAEAAWPLLIEEVSKRGAVNLTADIFGSISLIVLSAIFYFIASRRFRDEDYDVPGTFLMFGAGVCVLLSGLNMIGTSSWINMIVSPNLYLIERVLK